MDEQIKNKKIENEDLSENEEKLKENEDIELGESGSEDNDDSCEIDTDEIAFQRHEEDLDDESVAENISLSSSDDEDNEDNDEIEKQLLKQLLTVSKIKKKENTKKNPVYPVTKKILKK